MSDLVDSSLQQRSPLRRWLQRLALAFGMFAFVGVVAWAGFNLSHSTTGPARQVAKIALLPDTPPPPPPPPPDKPKIEPKNEIKQQIDKQKAPTPPEPQQLKMEGQAGDAPSAFAAGEVKKDYIGGDIGNGARYAAYVGRVEQRIQLELTRHKVRASNVKLFIWLQSDGSIQRYSIQGGDQDTERSVRLALADLNRIDEAPLADMPMPIGLRIN